VATGAMVAFTALSAGMSLYSGIRQSSAYSEYGTNLMKQAQIAQMENQYNVARKQRAIDQAAARQVMAMSKNGLDTSAGSPLEVLYNTYELGKQEVDALKRQGQAQVWKYTSEANQAFRGGRSALLGGVGNALSSIGTMATGIYARTGAGASSGGNLIDGVPTGWTPGSGGTTSASGGIKGTLPTIF